MSNAKELYISLRDDPDLNVPEGETRESAAWNEMSQRMRQHQSNAKALSMAVAPPQKDSISKLLMFLEKVDKPKNPAHDVKPSEREYLSGGQEAPEDVTVFYDEDDNPFYDKGEVAQKKQKAHDKVTNFIKSDIFDSLEMILKAASGDEKVTRLYRRAALATHVDQNKHKESFGGDEKSWEEFHNKHFNDVTRMYNGDDDDSTKEQFLQDFLDNWKDTKKAEFPNWTSDDENEHGVSHALHDHVSEWFNELNNRHSARQDETANSFRSMRQDLGMKIARKELTKDDLKNIQKHFNDHPSDFNHLKNDWKDNDGNSKWNNDVYKEYNTHTQPSDSGDGGGSTSSGTSGSGDGGSSSSSGTGGSSSSSGTGGTGGGNNDDPDDEQEKREAAVEELINKHEDRIREKYEEEYGPDNEDHTFEEYKSEMAKTAAASDKAFSKFKKDRAKAAHQYNKTQEEKANKAEQKERDNRATELINRVNDKGMKKMSMRAAHRLLDEHDGDVNSAFNAHSKATSDAAKSKKEAGELPYSTDEISKKVFGDVDPNSHFTHLSDDRKKNKFGQVSTTLARELLAHHRKYAGDMDKKTEQTLIDQLAFLKDPSTRFPNMKVPKGEQIGADIKAALDMVDEAIEAGYDPQSPEAQRIYDKREAERNRRVQHHQTSHVNPDSKEKKEASHGEGVDASDPDNRKGVFSETDNTSFLHFDEDGNVTGRKRLHPSGGEHHENFKDDGSDDHHHRGDHEARGSRVKEHIVPSHGSNLTNKEKASIESLREAHKAKATAERSGDAAASAKADEDIAQHTKDLTAGDMGLKESDFLHDEGDEPKVGPPDPQVAAHMRAQGLEWNEGIRHWVAKEGHDERTKANRGSLSHVGDGSTMKIYTAEVGADGKINQSPATGSFIHTNQGQYHAVDQSSDSIPSTHAGVQAQKFGQVAGMGEALGNASANGKAEKIASRDHRHLTAHSTSAGPKKDIFQRIGSAPKDAASGAASFAGRLGRLFKEETDNLSAVQSLQLHLALQKLEGKSKTVV